MSYIIGAGAVVGGAFAGAPVVSISMQTQPQIQRLYALNQADGVFNEVILAQTTAAVTCYAPGPGFDMGPTNDCSSVGDVNITVSWTQCAGGSAGGQFMIQGYSYSKDATTWGTCSYQFVSALTGSRGNSKLIAGIGEGSRTIGGADTGVTLSSPTWGGGISVEVQAGSPGIGRALSTEFGVCTNVGGGDGGWNGQEGQGQASRAITPIFI